MEPVLTPEEMAAADRATIAAGTPVDVLMERAGCAVAWEARRVLGRRYGVRAVAVCGPGNNGGDGVVAARVLSSWGVRVEAIDLATLGLDGVARLGRSLERADVALDAMFGTGLRRPLEGVAVAVVNAFERWGGPVVSVDIPSGVDGLTGAALGPAVRAAITVTFTARKPGLLFEPGRSYAGAVRVADIGIEAGGGSAPSTLAVMDESDVRSLLSPREPEAHKWTAGVFVLGGSRGMTGAPALVSRAALRAGAGIVWCGVPGAANGSPIAEVVTRQLPSTAEGSLAPDAAAAVVPLLARFRALAVGPGLGTEGSIGEAVSTIVAEAPVPLVLDADGLNALHRNLSPVRSRGLTGYATVLTPHDREFARLTGHDVGHDRAAAARELAAESGSVVLLKGPGTVVAAPDGRAVVNTTGGPSLAVAGTGDVLSGLTAALLARGLPAFEAAAVAAWVHGAAADRLAAEQGPVGMLAGDLADEIGRTLSELTPSRRGG